MERHRQWANNEALEYPTRITGSELSTCGILQRLDRVSDFLTGQNFDAFLRGQSGLAESMLSLFELVSEINFSRRRRIEENLRNPNTADAKASGGESVRWRQKTRAMNTAYCLCARRARLCHASVRFPGDSASGHYTAYRRETL